MNVNGRIRQMDSMMIEANIRLLSRTELIYACMAKVCIYLEKNHKGLLSDNLKAYADPNDFNRTFYHQRSENLEEKIQKLLDDADELVAACGTVMAEVTEYELLIRCLSEQTVMDGGKRRLRTKEDGMMNSAMLQNPSDPEATCRNKAGKIHRGYVANLKESLGKNGSVITNYQYEQNVHSDSQFLQDIIAETEPSAETVTMITDGGYGGGNNVELARQKNAVLIVISAGRE